MVCNSVEVVSSIQKPMSCSNWYRWM